VAFQPRYSPDLTAFSSDFEILTIDIHDFPDRTNGVIRHNLTQPGLAEESAKVGIDVNVEISIRNAIESVKKSSKTKAIMVETANVTPNLRCADK
jgi:hypothetical protein